jgi:hypothetical protein
MNSQPDLGEHGSDWVCTTAAMSGTIWCAITCMSTTVFATIADASYGKTRTGTLASMIFPAGITIFGAFTDFTLASGGVIAYRAGPAAKT